MTAGAPARSGRVWRSWRIAAVVAALLTGGLVATAAAGAASGGAGPQVLYVGSLAGVATPAASTFQTIQDAVDAAKTGDWILVAPGDYHESGDTGPGAPSPADLADGYYGGVTITTPGIHLRGMNRNSVIVDGTLPGSSPCSSAPADQNSLGGEGRNGILVWKANNVSIDNLTVCNFIAGSGSSGNEIWWNGNAGSGTIGVKGYSGNYLSATSSYFAGSDPSAPNVCGTCALYGIFSSNASGGSWNHLYANDFADSGMYVGACVRACSITINHADMEDNALGYSGTNSGGQVVIENSTFLANKDGFDTNTALTGDPPPPQDGRCPGNRTSTITHTRSCWVFVHNLVEGNNNPNVPISGTAGLGPTGTGMTVSGGRYDTIMDNEFLGNGAWGILFVPYPDPNTSSDGRTCTGIGGITISGLIAGVGCLFDPEGNALVNNRFSGNGNFGNASNADFGNVLAKGGEPTNCFSGNTEWDSSFTLQTGPATNANAIDGYPLITPSKCGAPSPSGTLLGNATDGTLLVQVECDAGVLSGPTYCTGASYPPVTGVTMLPLPAQPTMPNPCSGVPANRWCPNGQPASTGSVKHR